MPELLLVSGWGVVSLMLSKLLRDNRDFSNEFTFKDDSVVTNTEKSLQVDIV